MPNFFPRWRQWWRVFCQRCLTTEQPLQASSSLPLTRFVDVEMKSLIWFENVNIKDANGCLDFCEFLMAAHCITSATPRWYNCCCCCCCCWFLPLIQWIQQSGDGEFSQLDIFPPENFGPDIFKTKIWSFGNLPPPLGPKKTLKAVWFGKYIYTLYIYIYIYSNYSILFFWNPT